MGWFKRLKEGITTATLPEPVLAGVIATSRESSAWSNCTVNSREEVSALLFDCSTSLSINVLALSIEDIKIVLLQKYVLSGLHVKY